MKSFTLTYPDHGQDPENQIFEELGSGIEFDILDSYRKNGTLQIDVAVPDSVDHTYFSEAETAAEAGYTFENEKSELQEAPERWSITDAEDGYKYNSEIKVAGKMVQPAAIVYEWGNGTGEFYAEIYFSAAGADEYSEPLQNNGEPSHYADPVDSYEEAMERVKKYVEKYKSADGIRGSVNAPKEGN